MNQAMLIPTIDDIRSNATFEALMWALARPGSIHPLPFSGLDLLAESLLDRECSFHCSDPVLAARIAMTGAEAAPLSKAEYVFTALTDSADLAILADLQQGNLLYPDASATIFASAEIGRGTRLQLTGPGINGSIEIALGGVDPNFWALRAEAIRYPLGWDVYFAGREGLVGIPRSTKIEVL